MSIESIDYNQAQQFYNQGMEQYQNIAYGEENAKELLLMGFVARGAVLLSGAPGGAKSLLSRNAHRIFTDISDEEIAIVPPSAQLQDAQLVGDLMSFDKEITGADGTPTTEATRIEVKGIVKPDSKVIWVDEASRVNPTALNALLGAPEERKLKTTAGEIPLNSLQILMSTMNPSERREATSKMSAAFASRHNGGAIMGGTPTEVDGAKLLQGQMPDPYSVQPFVSTKELDQIREALKHVMLPEAEVKLAARLVEAAKTELYDEHQIKEENRMYVQMGKNAKILGMFKGRTANAEDVHQALNYVMASRIGALVSGKDTSLVLSAAVQNVLNRAA